MDFVSNQKPQIEAMLQEIGIGSVEELFAVIPKSLKISQPTVQDGLSEFEGLQLMDALSKKNSYQHFENYLGAGAYEHHIPALVDAICSRSEFLTSYTPYQAEISQGMLQAIFEYQAAICALTGMDFSNASLYDGASACAEALLMAMRLKKDRSEILISSALHPNYRQVVEQYLSCHSVTIIELPQTNDWRIDLEALDDLISTNTIAVLVQSPSFYGLIEDVCAISNKVKEKGSLLVLSANPLSFGIYASAGELGVDIAVGDCQPFGLPLEFGGPYVGYLACKRELTRQMPGRFVGETLDTEGRRGFVLTLQAREQHIRREKATSNICTNQALAALASLIAMMWYGKKGIPKLAQTNFARSNYLLENLKLIPGTKSLSKSPHFNEFTFSFGVPYKQVQDHFRSHKIEPGLHLGAYNPKLTDYFLVAVTETKSKQQLDRYVQVAEGLGRPL
ncbi:MAG: aminomethyl-transferring glycine dehydrogenase subunit GcvPA [Parachlamydiaceae bacterium]|nr:aminomethyl-transferring glycine dehydrogenase subunit GcvPA [Parachlamydiaceae bacterium]